MEKNVNSPDMDMLTMLFFEKMVYLNYGTSITCESDTIRKHSKLMEEPFMCDKKEHCKLLIRRPILLYCGICQRQYHYEFNRIF